ncbi:hypothetical protein Hdeb2414_s0107g00796621 [Helianthus debilis subsp. tardiflorus]
MGVSMCNCFSFTTEIAWFLLVPMMWCLDLSLMMDWYGFIIGDELLVSHTGFQLYHVFKS